MADTVLESIRLMVGGVLAFTELCLAGMKADKETCQATVEKSLAMATALNPYIGYQKAAELAKEAFASGKTIRELCLEKKILPEEQLAEALNPWRMTEPGR